VIELGPAATGTSRVWLARVERVGRNRQVLAHARHSPDVIQLENGSRTSR